jgi:hypothetical protein
LKPTKFQNKSLAFALGIPKNTQTRKIREETLPTVYGKTLFYSSRPGSMGRKTRRRVCFNGTVWDIYLPATRLLADETYGTLGINALRHIIRCLHPKRFCILVF